VAEATIIDVLDSHADRLADKVAFRFLEDGEVESRSLTYGGLDDLSNRIAATLIGIASAGARALLLYPAGRQDDFIVAFLGCLKAGVIAVPLYAPHARRVDERLNAITVDCQPTLVLSDEATLHRISGVLAGNRLLAHARRVATDVLAHEGPYAACSRRVGDLAFLQYTSGSTRTPRGVRVSHSNLVQNEKMIREAMQLGPESVFVSWLPVHHDMGLIGDTLQPLYNGASAVKMPPAAFLQRPIRWLRAVTAHSGTIIGGPSFAFDLCTLRTCEDERHQLDLSTLTVTYCGSEPVRRATLDSFATAFAPHGFKPTSFLPCYGLAEATLLVSGGPPMIGARPVEVSAKELEAGRIRPPRSTRAVSMVSCGLPARDSTVIIVDPNTLRECVDGEVGEIWVKGRHVCDGYWNAPELSNQITAAFTVDGRGPFLRTGDLGFLFDGEVVVAGRMKDVVIVRGRNYYPTDIEHTATDAHPMLRTLGVACFSVQDEAKERVVVVHEIARHATIIDVAEAKSAIRRAVTRTHEITPDDIVIAKVAAIPRTSSGKVRRAATRDRYLRGELELYSSALPATAQSNVHD
jgi:acyl-CoA synthetase (AMP-forming)/AMP-acid ligase II